MSTQTLREDLADELSTRVNVEALREEDVEFLLDFGERAVCDKGVATTSEAVGKAVEVHSAYLARCGALNGDEGE